MAERHPGRRSGYERLSSDRSKTQIAAPEPAGRRISTRSRIFRDRYRHLQSRRVGTNGLPSDFAGPGGVQPQFAPAMGDACRTRHRARHVPVEFSMSDLRRDRSGVPWVNEYIVKVSGWSGAVDGTTIFRCSAPCKRSVPILLFTSGPRDGRPPMTTACHGARLPRSTAPTIINGRRTGQKMQASRGPRAHRQGGAPFKVV